MEDAYEKEMKAASDRLGCKGCFYCDETVRGKSPCCTYPCVLNVDDATGRCLTRKNGHAELTYIKEVWTEQTGGNVMVDYIRLKSGELIGINAECIVNYGKVDDPWEAEEVWDDPENKNVIDLV